MTIPFSKAQTQPSFCSSPNLFSVMGQITSHWPTKMPQNWPAQITWRGQRPSPHFPQTEASVSPAHQGLASEAASSSRRGVSPSFQGSGRGLCGERTTRQGVARCSKLPLSLPTELEPNNRSALLEPCAASASAAAAAAARPAAHAPRWIKGWQDSAPRNSAFRAALPPLPQPLQPPQPPLCLR